MNQQERDALREKHRQDFCGCGDHPKTEQWVCVWCKTAVWPCDVIKVLDWAEQPLYNEPKQDWLLTEYQARYWKVSE